ncbi:MAG: peptidoglycan DD-metalloendopeptidase family protein [Pseudomonadota bacterium]|nr:peptidoglycan DD-metalloendopeptidase family protein [Pseudomonadota bacterium]
MLRNAWLIVICLLAGCASHPVNAPVGDRSERPLRNPDTHRVRQGDTLFSVAFLYGYTVEELASWNHLRAPYTIYKGQQLRLQAPAKSTPRMTAAKVSRPGKPAPRSSQPKPRYSTKVKTKTPSPLPRRGAASAQTSSSRQSPAPSSTPVHWSWPVRGRVIRSYNPKSAGKKGVNIAGKTGESVRAAAAGKVVYAGSGLSGYGRLIIIKHNKNFLSAYAHNRKLIAEEGKWVEKGEVIAQMGSSGTDRTQLHFEIRKRGRPVDPLSYLPKR